MSQDLEAQKHQSEEGRLYCLFILQVCTAYQCVTSKGQMLETQG